MAESPHKSWQTWLDPIAKGLIALMAAGAMYLQSSSSSSNDIKFAEIDKRVALMEQQVIELQSNQSKFSEKIDKILDVVTDIKVNIAASLNSKHKP